MAQRTPLAKKAPSKLKQDEPSDPADQYYNTNSARWPDNQVGAGVKKELVKLGWHPDFVDEVIWKESSKPESPEFPDKRMYYVSCVSWVFLCWAHKMKGPNESLKGVKRSATPAEIERLRGSGKVEWGAPNVHQKIVVNFDGTQDAFYDVESKGKRWIWPLNRMEELKIVYQ